MRKSLFVMGSISLFVGSAMLLAGCAGTQPQCKVWGPMGHCLELENPDGGGAAATGTTAPATTAPECQPAKPDGSK